MKKKLIIILITLFVISYALLSFAIWRWDWELMTTSWKFVLQWVLTFASCIPLCVVVAGL